MHKLKKIFIFAALSTLTAQTIFAVYPNGVYGANQRDWQDQTPYNQPYSNSNVDQYSPDMSGENSFMIQSQNQYERMNQQNRNMIEQDRRMMKQGYDPNENYYDNKSNHIQQQYDKNNPSKNQEQMMRGNDGFFTIQRNGRRSCIFDGLKSPIA